MKTGLTELLFRSLEGQGATHPANPSVKPPKGSYEACSPEIFDATKAWFLASRLMLQGSAAIL